MKRKFITLSIVSLILAIALFVLSFYIFHYITPEGKFSNIWYSTPNKPFVTNLFAIWGVMHLFTSTTSLLIAKIFFN